MMRAISGLGLDLVSPRLDLSGFLPFFHSEAYFTGKAISGLFGQIWMESKKKFIAKLTDEI